MSVIILVINKSDSRFAVVRFCEPLVWLKTELDFTQSYYHYFKSIKYFRSHATGLNAHATEYARTTTRKFNYMLFAGCLDICPFKLCVPQSPQQPSSFAFKKLFASSNSETALRVNNDNICPFSVSTASTIPWRIEQRQRLTATTCT